MLLPPQIYCSEELKMGLKSIEYDRENVQLIMEAAEELARAFTGLARCIEHPDASYAGDLIQHRAAYINARERLETAVETLLGPDNLLDPDDIVAVQTLKELGEMDDEEGEDDSLPTG